MIASAYSSGSLGVASENHDGRSSVILFTIGSAIVLLALLLRLHHLGTEELWVDEVASLYWTKASLTALISKGMPLYLTLLRGWVRIAGESELALRLPSALFGTLCVGLVMWWGKEIFNATVGLWSGLFAALSPIHVYYSQEARAYALLTVTVLLCYYALWQALKKDSWLSWTVLSLCAVVSVATHYVSILGLLCGAVLIVLWPGKRAILSGLIRFGLAMLPSILLGTLWFHERGVETGHRGSDWVKQIWEQTPLWLAIPKSVEIFGLGSQAGLIPLSLKQFNQLEFPPVLRLVGLCALLGILLVALVPWGEGRLAIPRLVRRKVWLTGLLFLPLLAMWLASYYKPIYTVGRYDMVAFPAYSLLVGLGLAKIQSVPRCGKWLAPAAALLLLGVLAVKLGIYYQTSARTRFRSTAAALHQYVENSDVVVFTELRGLPVIYYLGRLGYTWSGGVCEHSVSGRRFGCRMFPTETEHSPALYTPERVLRSRDEVRKDLQVFLGDMGERENSFWLILSKWWQTLTGVKLFEPDSLLVEELKREGFEPVRLGFPEAPGIVQFRRFQRVVDNPWP